MDRNAVENVTVSAEELIALLNNQIGQLNAEILANRIIIQKLQDMLASRQDARKKLSEDF
jgi:hypothetical protein